MALTQHNTTHQQTHPMMVAPSSRSFTMPAHERHQALPSLYVSIAVVFTVLLAPTNAQKFEPYQLNGGLVSAVAAKDFVVIATDTRFHGEGGYDILSRDHVESRLWMAGDDSSPLSLHRRLATAGTARSPSLLLSSLPKGTTLLQSLTGMGRSPTFVGSSGCNADCEALKRYVQADLRSAMYFGECSTSEQQQQEKHPPVDSVATLLSQMLYSRRGFPFYSFCVVAGISHDDASGDGGQVYVYDAIGSYEQVAVATSGTGRELLQPILDGKFRTVSSSSGTAEKGMVMAQSSTVPTQVDCTAEEAVSILIDAYRSVSEREIGVGDKMVVCVVKRHANVEKGVECTTFSVPLKQH